MSYELTRSYTNIRMHSFLKKKWCPNINRITKRPISSAKLEASQVDSTYFRKLWIFEQVISRWCVKINHCLIWRGFLLLFFLKAIQYDSSYELFVTVQKCFCRVPHSTKSIFLGRCCENPQTQNDYPPKNRVFYRISGHDEYVEASRKLYEYTYHLHNPCCCNRVSDHVQPCRNQRQL